MGRLFFVLTLWLFYNIDGNCQDTVVYVAKCREHNHLKKYNCITLKLLPLGRFEYLKLAVDLPLALYKGKYTLHGDTLITVSDDINKEVGVSREKSGNDFFCIKFTGYWDYPVVIDSVKVYDKGEVVQSSTRISFLNFPDADSIKYYMQGNGYKIWTNLSEYKQDKLIKISLPVGYYSRKDDDTLVEDFTKIELKKINVP